jgi:tRNA(Arg) A34 adenosine deaminase TadA
MMRGQRFSVLIFAAVLVSCACSLESTKRDSSYEHNVTTRHVPFDTRAYWMRRAIEALAELDSPCPLFAFGTAIVNHTSNQGLGELVCIGANSVVNTGNPSLHGEVAGIKNCTKVLSNPRGKHKLSPNEVYAAWKDLTLYTTAEPCSMCASAIRWGLFKECVYGTSIPTMTRYGWTQIPLRTSEVFERSQSMGMHTELVEGILSNETDPLFAWQYQPEEPCPSSCSRNARGGRCTHQPKVPHRSDDQTIIGTFFRRMVSTINGAKKGFGEEL